MFTLFGGGGGFMGHTENSYSAVGSVGKENVDVIETWKLLHHVLWTIW